MSDGKDKLKEFNDYDFKEHSPSPWGGDTITTNSGTLTMVVRDVNDKIVAEVNELNPHSQANLALIRRADLLLDAAKQCSNIILSETNYKYKDFLFRLDSLIKEAENRR